MRRFTAGRACIGEEAQRGAVGARHGREQGNAGQLQRLQEARS